MNFPVRTIIFKPLQYFSLYATNWFKIYEDQNYHFYQMLNGKKNCQNGMWVISINLWHTTAAPTTTLEKTLPLTVIFTPVEKKTSGNQIHV